MSQRDLVAELQAARIQVPVEVRERVRAIAAEAAAPTSHRFRRRRSLVLLVPLAAALVGAVVVTRQNGADREQLVRGRAGVATVPYRAEAAPSAPAPAPPSAKAFAPTPSSTRVQRYGATIGLQVASPNAVSNAVEEGAQRSPPHSAATRPRFTRPRPTRRASRTSSCASRAAMCRRR